MIKPNQTFNQLYERTYTGWSSPSRSGDVTYILNQTWQFEPGTTVHRRGDNLAIGIIEGLQFIAGIEDKEAIVAVAPKIDISLFGANSFYGPRVGEQAQQVINRLSDSATTRRAVITLARPGEHENNLPCTLAVQFTRDRNVLFPTFMMRSTDLIWGAPYDMVQFSMFSYAIATCISPQSIHIGQHTVFTSNAHVYDKTSVRLSAWSPVRFGIPARFFTWEQWQEWARNLVSMHYRKDELLKLFYVTIESESEL